MKYIHCFTHMHACKHANVCIHACMYAFMLTHDDQDPSSRTNSLWNHCWLSGQSFIGSLTSSENCSVMLLCLMCCCMWCIVYVGVCRQRTMTDVHWGTNSCSRRPVSVTSSGDSIANRKCLHRASQLTHTQPEVSLSFCQGTNVVKKYLI